MNDTGGPHNYTIIRLCILVEFVVIIRAKIYSHVASCAWISDNANKSIVFEPVGLGFEF